jgi:hypothetical protein
MTLFLVDLDKRTRQLMLEEMEYDTARNQLHISPFLSGQGQRDYPNLLREAIENGDETTLSAALNEQRRIERAMPRKQQKGGFQLVAAPYTAADTVAESEFNRYYIRALCRRAIEDGIPELIVYRARPTENPRPESEELVETTVDPAELLADLRAHPGQATALGIPAGPNSGISVRLP